MSPLRSRSGGMVTVVAEIRSARPGWKSSGKRPARSCDQANVDRIGAVAADRANFAGGEYAIEPRLGLVGQRANLVEQQRSAVGLDQPADPFGEGAREGAGHMAEQFAVDDVGRDRLAVDLDQRPAGAQAGVMDGAGEGFLAAARLRRRSGSAGGCARALAATASAARKSGAAPTSWSSDSSGAIFSDSGASSPVARRRSAWAASASINRSGATGLAR